MRLPKLKLGKIVKSALFLPLLLGLVSFAAWPYFRPVVFGQVQILATINPFEAEELLEMLGEKGFERVITDTADPDDIGYKPGTALGDSLLKQISYNTRTGEFKTTTSVSESTYKLVSNDAYSGGTLESTPRSGLALDGSLTLVVELLGPDGTVVDAITSTESLHIPFPGFMWGGKQVTSLRAKLTGSFTLTGAYVQTTPVNQPSGSLVEQKMASTQGTVTVGIRMCERDVTFATYFLSPDSPKATVSLSATYGVVNMTKIWVEALGTSNIGLRTESSEYGWIRIHNIQGPKIVCQFWTNDPVSADELRVPITTNTGLTAYFGLLSVPYPNSGSVNLAGGSGNPTVNVIMKAPGTYTLGWVSIPDGPCTKNPSLPVSFTVSQSEVVEPYMQVVRGIDLPTVDYQPFPFTLEIAFVSQLADDELTVMTKPYTSGATWTNVATVKSGEKATITLNLRPDGYFDRYIGWKTRYSKEVMEGTSHTYTSPRSYHEVWNSGKKISMTVTTKYEHGMVRSVQMETAPVIVADDAKFTVKVYGPTGIPVGGLPVEWISIDRNLNQVMGQGVVTTDSKGEAIIDPPFKAINRNSTQCKFFVYDPAKLVVLGYGTVPLWSISPVYIVNIKSDYRYSTQQIALSETILDNNLPSSVNSTLLDQGQANLATNQTLQEIVANKEPVLNPPPSPSESQTIQNIYNSYANSEAGPPPESNPNRQPVEGQPQLTGATASANLDPSLTNEALLVGGTIAILAFLSKKLLRR